MNIFKNKFQITFLNMFEDCAIYNVKTELVFLN